MAMWRGSGAAESNAVRSMVPPTLTAPGPRPESAPDRRRLGGPEHRPRRSVRSARVLYPSGPPAAPPVEPPPSRWAMPPVAQADEDGLVGVGADLEPGTLLRAYRQGLFPMPLGLEG